MDAQQQAQGSGVAEQLGLWVETKGWAGILGSKVGEKKWREKGEEETEMRDGEEHEQSGVERDERKRHEREGMILIKLLLYHNFCNWDILN